MKKKTMCCQNSKVILLLFLLSACSNNTQQSGNTNTQPTVIPNHHFTAQTVNTLPITSARLADSGFITCFPLNLKTDEDLPVYCKTSAVTYYNDTLIFASDEPIVGEQRSAVFTINYKNNQLQQNTLTYFTQPIFTNTVGYSDFALTPDSQYIFATTSFDRVKENSAEWNSYNTLLMWRTDDPNTVQVVSPTIQDDITSSIILRNKLAYSLSNDEYPNGVPFFTVEGLAVIPGNKLLFGIGEVGTSYEDFEPVIKLVAVSYHIENDTLLLEDDFQVVYNYDSSSVAALRYPVALSGLEYDKYHDQLLLLTRAVKTIPCDSLETFVWSLSIAELEAIKPPHLLLDSSDKSKPLIFAHKAEDITLLNSSTAFVIHDDDFILTTPTIDSADIDHTPNQAAYSVINLIMETFTPLKITR